MIKATGRAARLTLRVVFGGTTQVAARATHDARVIPSTEEAKAPSDSCPALRQLARLGSELAAAGVDAQIRQDLHALAVPTVKPGTYIWVYPDAAHQRFHCYLNDLCEQLTGDPQTAARDIAAFARAGR